MTERWLIQVEEKMKRGNQILFDRNSVLLQPLIDLLCVQNRRAVVLWCLDGMEEILERIRLIDPAETRAEEAVRQCRLWAAGKSACLRRRRRSWLLMRSRRRAMILCWGHMRMPSDKGAAACTVRRMPSAWSSMR